MDCDARVELNKVIQLSVGSASGLEDCARSKDGLDWEESKNACTDVV